MRFTGCLMRPTMRGGSQFLKSYENIPNQRGGMWQDPILGYFETHGKTEFKEGEEYDLTDEQKEVIMERYLKKERLKREYLAMQYNPQRFNYIQGVITDPAMFRWYATDMSHTERFRLTPRTGITVIAVLLIFFWGYNRYAIQPFLICDDKAAKAETLWWDRENRLWTVSGTGACATGQMDG